MSFIALLSLRTIGIRRSFRQEEGVPHRRLDARQPLLAGGREIGDDRHALRRHHRDALDVALLGLRRAGLDGVAHVVDAAADQILHHRSGAAIGHVRDVDARSSRLNSTQGRCVPEPTPAEPNCMFAWFAFA